MANIVILGAAGKAGARAVEEAVRRGHSVVAVTRTAREWTQAGVTGAVGDATSEADIARLAVGADAVVMAGARLDVAAAKFFAATTAALVGGVLRAGVGRLVLVGIGTTLEVAPGLRVMDAPDFPEAARAFSAGHAVQLEALAASPDELDWVVVTPPPVFLTEDDQPQSVTLTRGPLIAQTGGDFSYSDLAVALVDEADGGAHHRVQVAVSRVAP